MCQLLSVVVTSLLHFLYYSSLDRQIKKCKYITKSTGNKRVLLSLQILSFFSTLFHFQDFLTILFTLHSDILMSFFLLVISLLLRVYFINSYIFVRCFMISFASLIIHKHLSIYFILQCYVSLLICKITTGSNYEKLFNHHLLFIILRPCLICISDNPVLKFCYCLLVLRLIFFL